MPSWIQVDEKSRVPMVFARKLDAGEREVLQLAVEMKASVQRVDDQAARLAAAQ